MDFWISDWISGFHSGFLDFSLDFWISGFQFGFLQMVYEISFVTDPSELTENTLRRDALCCFPTALLKLCFSRHPRSTKQASNLAL